MPSLPARLSNCYVPLPVPGKQTEAIDIGDIRKRDQRAPHELRQVLIQVGVTSAQGSALLEIGHTKVLAQVNISTRDLPPQTNLSVEEGTLLVSLRFASHVGQDSIQQRLEAVQPLDASMSSGKMHSKTVALESDQADRIQSAIRPAVHLAKFPKAAVCVDVTILQDDGAVLATSINAATIALIDARVELFDMVTCCTVLVDPSNEVFFADPRQCESSRAAMATVDVAYLPNFKEITMWNQSGALSMDQSEKAMDICLKGCRTFHRFIREYFLGREGT